MFIADAPQMVFQESPCHIGDSWLPKQESLSITTSINTLNKYQYHFRNQSSNHKAEVTPRVLLAWTRFLQSAPATENSTLVLIDSVFRCHPLVAPTQISLFPLGLSRGNQGVEVHPLQGPYYHGWNFPKRRSHKYALGSPGGAFDLLPSDLCLSSAQPHTSQ